jgi:hypothetical protein
VCVCVCKGSRGELQLFTCWLCDVHLRRNIFLTSPYSDLRNWLNVCMYVYDKQGSSRLAGPSSSSFLIWLTTIVSAKQSWMKPSGPLRPDSVFRPLFKATNNGGFCGGPSSRTSFIYTPLNHVWLHACAFCEHSHIRPQYCCIRL